MDSGRWAVGGAVADLPVGDAPQQVVPLLVGGQHRPVQRLGGHGRLVLEGVQLLV